ncbi:MAG: glycosyltransferase [Streptosporangiales bacterium]
MTEPRTVLFLPESAYGPTNNCIGIGDVLRRRGHRVVFAAEASWQGKLAALGFDEDLVDLAPPAPEQQDAGQAWKDFITETVPEFRKPTREQLATVVRPIWEELVSGARYSHDQLSQVVARQRPDIVVEDNVVCFPALMTADAPFVRIVSCNPLEVKGERVPPTFSGYPSADSRGWDGFRAEYDRVMRPFWDEFNAWVTRQGAPPLPDLEFIHTSPHLNLYLYPEAADYTDQRPLDGTWHRLASSIRDTEEPFELPASLRDRQGPVVYLSLGSLGSADVELMQRLVDCLAATPYRFIVSKGPRHKEVKLAENMWGAEMVPQTRVIPLADVVITHGGNNTVTETLHFGKPQVVLPLFWDQYDNAQRVDELGLGVRLDPYRFTDADMHATLDGLLSDTALHARLAEMATAIRERRGVIRAADLIEQVAAP